MRVSERRTMAFRFAVALLAGVFWMITAQAQQTVDSEQLQRALGRAQGLLQQLSQQKLQLEAAQAESAAAAARLKRELARERVRREDLEAALSAGEREKGVVDARLERTTARLARVEERLTEVVEKYRTLAAQQRHTLSEKVDLEGKLAATRQALAEARSRNESLYQANSELLTHFVNKGPWQALLQREPLTGIGRVAVENLEQDYRFRNEDGRLARESEPESDSNTVE